MYLSFSELLALESKLVEISEVALLRLLAVDCKDTIKDMEHNWLVFYALHLLSWECIRMYPC